MATDTVENADKLDWNDKECHKIASKDTFPLCVRDSAVQKGIIIRFFNFYLGGKSQKGICASDLVFAILSIMPCSPMSDKLLWNKELYKEHGTLFYLFAESKITDDVKKIIEKSEGNLNGPEPNVQNENNLRESTTDTEQDATDKSEKPNSVGTQSEGCEGDQDNCKDIGKDSNKNNKDSEIKQENILLDFPTEFKWYGESKPSLGENSKEPTLLFYTPVDNAAFIRSCDKLLERWDADEFARAMLKYFFGVIALHLMRATTKSFKHLTNVFRNKTFLNVLHFSKEHVHFSPPHKRCLKACFRVFSRKDGKIAIMFSYLTLASVMLDDGNKFKKLINNALMSCTADYGLNLVNMWRTINKIVAPNHMKIIAEITLCEKTEESWRKLIDFFKRYMSPSSYSKTHHWARVMNPNYFKEVSCQQNFELAVFLAVFVDKLTGNPGIWKSTWVTNDDRDDLEKYKEIGYKLYENFIAIRDNAK